MNFNPRHDLLMGSPVDRQSSPPVGPDYDRLLRKCFKEAESKGITSFTEQFRATTYLTHIGDKEMLEKYVADLAKFNDHFVGWIERHQNDDLDKEEEEEEQQMDDVTLYQRVRSLESGPSGREYRGDNKYMALLYKCIREARDKGIIAFTDRFWLWALKRRALNKEAKAKAKLEELLRGLEMINDHFSGWMERAENVELLEKWGHDGNETVGGDDPGCSQFVVGDHQPELDEEEEVEQWRQIGQLIASFQNGNTE